MSVRITTQTVLDKTFGPSATPGSSSVAGIEAQTFLLPQDLDNVVMKWQQASISGTGTVSLLFQTSDDGGSTWFDVARTNTYSSSNGATSITSGTAEWASIPVISNGQTSKFTTSLMATGSLIGVSNGVIGKTASSTLAAGQLSGLPLLGTAARVGVIYTGAITTNDGIRVKVIVNSQSATA